MIVLFFLFQMVQISGFKLIGIDENDGAGKSTLAKEIASAYDYHHLEIDNLRHLFWV